ncbi:MAG: hypothetical protein U0S13_01185 [Mycobacterium sp.]
MSTTTTSHAEHAMWRSDVVRARLHLCPTGNRFGIANEYGTTPAAAKPATATARRGAPPP